MKGALASSRPGYDAGSVPPHGHRLRLMIVDDSMVARAVLSRMVETDGGFEIAAVAGTAEDAIEALGQVRVDVILLDLEMPGAGGLKSIPRILAAARGGEDARNGFEAARAGHFEIEQDDVDPDLAERFDRILGGAGNGGDFEPAVGFHHPAQHRAGNHRIVDDHQAQAMAVRRHGPGVIAGPRRGERALHVGRLRRRRRVGA